MAPRVVVGQKVTGDDFYDRRELMDSLWELLPTQSVELVAPRRFGKTSVMQRLIDLPQAGCHVAFMDCEAIHSPKEFTKRLGDVLLHDDTASKVTHEAGHALRGIPGFLRRVRKIDIGLEGGLHIDLADHDSATWSTSIDSLLNSVRRHGCHLVAILDEFSMMLDNFARKKVDPVPIVNLLEWLRRIRMEQTGSPVLTFVIGGSMNLDYWLRHLKATALMNDLQRVEVTPFDAITARSFIAGLLESEHLDWEADVPEAILRHIQPALPFWIQATVWLLAQQPGRARRITVADVGEAYRQRLLSATGRHFFQPFEERLSRYGPEMQRAAQRILISLAATHQPGGVRRDMLAGIFVGTTGDQSPEAFDWLFADLRSDFYIRYNPDDDSCVFAHSVLRDWWLAWHPTAAASLPSEPTRG